MPTLTLPERTLNRLHAVARERNEPVEVLIEYALDRISVPPFLPPGPGDSRTVEERLAALAAWRAAVEARADRYPPGFAVDTDRANAYPDR
jgi:hypothetical protein